MKTPTFIHGVEDLLTVMEHLSSVMENKFVVVEDLLTVMETKTTVMENLLSVVEENTTAMESKSTEGGE